MSPQQPVLVLFNVPQMSASQYDAITHGLEAADLGHVPDRLYHVAAPNGADWTVVDVWTSAEAFADFGETLTPLIQKAGVMPREPRILPVHNQIGASAQESSQAYLAAAEKARQHFNAGEIDAYLETLYTPDARLHFLPPNLPGGHAGARIFYQVFLAAFPDAHLTFDDILIDGNKMAIRYHLEMTHTGEFQGVPPTAKRVTLKGLTILEFERGKVVERWSESDFMGLMMQLGAIPTPA